MPENKPSNGDQFPTLESYLAGVFESDAVTAPVPAKDKRSHIGVIWTGGTISSVEDNLSGAALPGLTGPQFYDRYIRQETKDRYRIDWHVPDTFSQTGIDSTEITTKYEKFIVHKIYKLLTEHPEYEGIVVCHGTDTAEYTSGYAALALQNLPKPVVFTGSQIPPGGEGTDAMKNFELALRTARSDVAEVLLAFKDAIFRAIGVTKVEAVGEDAFDTPHQWKVGAMHGLHLNLDPGVRTRPVTQPNLLYNGLQYFPGLKGRVQPMMRISPHTRRFDLENYFDPLNYHAAMVEGFGPGNIPSRLKGIIQEVARQMQIIIIPRAGTRGNQSSTYEGSPELQFGSDVIFAREHTAAIAEQKYMWLHAQGQKLGFEGARLRRWISQRFHYNITGELTRGKQEFPKQAEQAIIWRSRSPEAPNLPYILDFEKSNDQFQKMTECYEKFGRALGLDQKTSPTLQQWIDNRRRMPLPQDIIENGLTDEADHHFRIILTSPTLMTGTLSVEQEAMELQRHKVQSA